MAQVGQDPAVKVESPALAEPHAGTAIGETAAASSSSTDAATAAQFNAMLEQASTDAAREEMARSRQNVSQTDSFFNKLLKGKTTKQGKLIERAIQEHEMVDAALDQQQKKQQNMLHEKLAGGKKKKKKADDNQRGVLSSAVSSSAAGSVAAISGSPAKAAAADFDFTGMLAQASADAANQEMALSRANQQQQDALFAKLMKGKSTKHRKMIEQALQESGLVEQAIDEQQKKQADMMAARLAAGKKKKQRRVGDEEEEKYPSRLSAAAQPPANEPKPVVDYLEQKYGEMLGEDEEETSADKAKDADAAKAAQDSQAAIVQATSVGMKTGADGVKVAQLAAQAAAMGLSPEQIKAAAEAAAAVSAMKDTSDADHATFMDLFRQATEAAAAEHMKRKQAQSAQDEEFMRKLMRGKKTKQQKMLDEQMEHILAANRKALSFQSAQDEEMARRLARGKKRRTGTDAQRLAAEELATETLMSSEQHGMSAALSEAAAVEEQIQQLISAPTILDELLAVSSAQSEELYRQSLETGVTVEELEVLNKDALQVDNVAAQLMLEKAREAEEQGDAEGAAAFMDMYRRMLEEQMGRQSAMKRQLDASEEALMRKLMRGKTTKQQKLIESAFQNASLVAALQNQEAARQQALFEAKLAAGKLRRKNEAQVKLAEETFARLRKIFLGAIKKLDAANIIRQLEDAKELVDAGYLDLNRAVKEVSGDTMLHQAAKYGRYEVVEWLIKQGNARVNIANVAGQAPLHLAALSLDPDGADGVTPDNAANTCLALIESGGDVNLEDLSLQTPLSIAAALGFDLSALANTPEALDALALERQKEAAHAISKEAVEMSLAAEADDENQAAMLAAQQAAEAAAQQAVEEMQRQQQMIQDGAGTMLVDPNTGLPFSEQQLQMQSEELQSLLSEEALTILPPPPAGKLSDPVKIRKANLVFLQLCDLFRDLTNQRNESEAIQLIKANLDLIQEGYLNLIRPVKHKQDGSTLLHIAVLNQRINAVRQLLQNRADPNAVTMTGESSLHLACSLADREPHGKAIVSLLLEAGGNLQLRDYKNGHTPLDKAPNAAIRKWIEDWLPLAERQRRALAAHMGGLDALLAKNKQNLQNAALSAENSFLEKLMRGKITRQGKLIEEALKMNDALNARALSEQQKQLEDMMARLARGKARRAGALTMEDTITLATDKTSAAQRKRAAMMENMLLSELSEPTKEKIMLAAEKWADHPQGLTGLDVHVLSKLRGMAIAEGIKLLATEIAGAESEQMRLSHAINAPGLDEIQAQEYERQFNIADCNADIYKDLTNNMLEAEKKRQEELQAQNESSDAAGAQSEEDLAVARAKERLDEIARKKAAQKALAQSRLPMEILEPMCVAFAEYVAINTGYELEPALFLDGAVPMEDLEPYGLDTETIETMLGAMDIEAAKSFLAKQNNINETVLENTTKKLDAEPNMHEQQKEELQLRVELCQTNSDLYGKLMNILVSGGAMMQEEDVDLASQRMEEASEMDASVLVHPDTGLSMQLHIQETILEQMRELAAEHLGLSAAELGEMSGEQLQQSLAQAGVNVDVLEELRKLTESEAAKYLARGAARNRAEADMLKKLLSGKKLSDKKRAELLARQKALEDAADLYNDMLSTLLTGEKTRFAHLSREEQLAQERMLAKLEARRRKKEQEELDARKKRQESELVIMQQEAMMDESMHKEAMAKPVLDESGQPVLNADGTPKMEMVMEDATSFDRQKLSEIPPAELLAKGVILHQLLGDNPALLRQLQDLVAEHVGMSLEDFLALSDKDAHLKLAEKGVDFNLLDHLKTLTSMEAAKHLAKEMGKAEAEANMLRKALQNNDDLTPQQRDEMMSRVKELEDNAQLYEDMLRTVLEQEKKKRDQMSKEEQATYDSLQAKLALRKARSKAKEQQQQIDENSELLALFDHLAPKGKWECRVCQTVNDAAARACSFCKKSRVDTLTLSELTLWNAHRLLHHCDCSFHVVEVVHREIGPCNKKNFFTFMQAILIACNREKHVLWDSACVDGDGLGALDGTSSELVWGFNDWDIEQPRYHRFKEKHADEVTGQYIGWEAFREECVQMPNIQDYM